MSDLEKRIKTKIEQKKVEKEKKLLDSAYNLFTTKGINNTSIQDIVNNAGVAKGTFYLYFHDKYELEEALIIKKSTQLFNDALNEVKKKKLNNFDDEIIFVIDYIINLLSKDDILTKFISKDLSLGLYNDKLTRLIDNNELGIYDKFMEEIKSKNVNLKNPDVTLFMIIELVSSTCFSSITKGKPLPIDEYKPYLYAAIRSIIKN